MTLSEAIGRVDAGKPNSMPEADKIAWLSMLDGKIQANVLAPHGAAGEFPGYDMDTDRQTVLLAPAPYDAIYLRWLEAQIDLANLDYPLYNAAITLFNAEFAEFENDYNRNHRMPASRFRF